jgi:hypothetical protein
LPPPSEAFQRDDLALSKARKARAGAPGVRLRKVAK